MSSDQVTIIIADDHPWVIEGVSTIIRDNTAYKILATVNDGEKLVTAVRSQPVDLILLDLNLPKLSGLEAAEKIKRDFPKVKIIVITTYEEIKIINALKNLGVEGYLPKTAGAQELLLAMQKVVSGKKVYLERQVAIEPVIHDGFVDKFKLTKRELEVMQLIASGLTTKEVAEKLFLSDQTVHTHRKNISHKIGSSEALAISKFLAEHISK